MSSTTANQQRYDPTTIVFHWLVAILVLAQWLGAHTIDWFPRGPLRVDARSLHIILGVSLGGILAARVAWRLGHGRNLPPVGRGWMEAAARAVHLGLYALVAAAVAVGVALTWARGDSLFNLVRIPSFDPGNRALVEQIQEIHEAIGWAILVGIGVHAAAALYHQYALRDGLLHRMKLGG